MKSDAHWNWIERTRLYNLRADDRQGSVGLDSPELSANLIVLYSKDPSPRVELWTPGPGFFLKSADDLTSLGYPDVRGTRYCCFQLTERTEPATPMDPERVKHLARRGHPEEAWGAPAVVTWAELSVLMAEAAL